MKRSRHTQAEDRRRRRLPPATNTVHRGDAFPPPAGPTERPNPSAAAGDPDLPTTKSE